MRGGDEVVLDTTVLGPSAEGPSLQPGAYDYAVLDPAGDTLGLGRFDVAAATRSAAVQRSERREDVSILVARA